MSIVMVPSARVAVRIKLGNACKSTLISSPDTVTAISVLTILIFVYFFNENKCGLWKKSKKKIKIT